MPNHITNELTVRGPQSAVLAFLEKAKQREGSDFSFRGFVPPPDNDIYNGGACGHRDHSGPLADCWYPWNNANWGTKWDAYSVEVIGAPQSPLMQLASAASDDDPHCEVLIRFDTAWSPPSPVIDAIIEDEDHSALSFDFRWHDEGEDEWCDEW